MTVIWSCGGDLGCTTGKIAAIYDGVILVRGLAPTVEERLHGDPCADLGALELVTAVDLERVCAIVFGLPPCRKAAFPFCCVELDPSARTGPRSTSGQG
ncbi:MAG: hypothetical protein K6V73_01880 [Firmicutes bacterium]|nr:hypothetical protein [Bacillota bacterium]